MRIIFKKYLKQLTISETAIGPEKIYFRYVSLCQQLKNAFMNIRYKRIVTNFLYFKFAWSVRYSFINY